MATKSLQAKAPIGTTVRYRLDGAARVTFTITKPVPGRRKGRRCVKPAAAKPGAKRCIRTQKLKGSFAHQGVAGQNAFRFTGRLRGKALAPGRYTLVARLPRPATGRVCPGHQGLPHRPLTARGRGANISGRSRGSPRAAHALIQGEPVKVRASVKPICEKCRVIKRHGKLLVICTNARHKQVQG